ncbi:histidinol-phosphatase [Planctomycetales bacterium]|nr:histidinol-phosphatase [Planctomycetales bacterium]
MLEHLTLAKKIAEEAAALTLRYYHESSRLKVFRKDDESPVTIADRETELLIRKQIEEQFPNDSILGEEYPNKEGSSGYRWILDPIDGTKSFIHHVPLYSCLIGVEKDGRNIAGVIALPATGEMYWAARGTGTFRSSLNSLPQNSEPERVSVSQCSELKEALFLTSEVKTFKEVQREHIYKTLEEKSRLTRTWGDGYGYAMVACGRADIMVDPLLSDWDTGPLLVIIEEAGGHFTDWKGNATSYGKEGVATNGLLHTEVLRILNETAG